MKQGTSGGARWFRLSAAQSTTFVVAILSVGALVITSAQIPRNNQNIAPVFEGWERNPDGSFNLMFGYFNRNWDDEIDLPVGERNSLQPGGPDQGQPTHFYPRRSRFLFRVPVPKDFGKKEIVWTLTVNGKTDKAYGTLNPDYLIDDRVFQANSGEPSGGKNTGPVLKIDGEEIRRAKVGTPLTLIVHATDDGFPKATAMRPPGTGGVSGFPIASTGLRFSWFVYRGAAKVVTFDPLQFSAWEDDRDGRNSPYSTGWVPPPVPPEGKWVVKATFREPGTYVLRALAHDGGLFAFTNITVEVER